MSISSFAENTQFGNPSARRLNPGFDGGMVANYATMSLQDLLAIDLSTLNRGQRRIVVKGIKVLSKTR